MLKIATAASLAVLISAGLLFALGCGDSESGATPVALAPTIEPTAEPTPSPEPTTVPTSTPEPTATPIPAVVPTLIPTSVPIETPAPEETATPASPPSAAIADNSTETGGDEDQNGDKDETNGPAPIPVSEMDEAELMRALFGSQDDGIIPPDLSGCVDEEWPDVPNEYEASADETARMSALETALQEFEGASSYRTLMSMSTVFEGVEGESLAQVESVVALCWDYGTGAAAFTPDSDVSDGEVAMGVVSTAVEGIPFFSFPFVSVDNVLYGFNPLDSQWELSGDAGGENVTPQISDAMPQIAEIFTEGEARDGVEIDGGAAEYMGERVWAYEATGVPSDAIPSLAEYSEGGHRAFLLIGIDDERIKYIEIESKAKNPCEGPSAPTICAMGDASLDEEIDAVFLMRIRIDNLGIPFRAVVPTVE